MLEEFSEFNVLVTQTQSILVWFLCLMAYQPSCQRYACRRTAVILFITHG